MEPPRCRKNKTECKMAIRNEEPHVNKCFPRVRGDVPEDNDMVTEIQVFSPRARGCSFDTIIQNAKTNVFPACAGMFRFSMAFSNSSAGFPRVRGDVPECGGECGGTSWFSPRARGCSGERPQPITAGRVFPACAGMFRPLLKPHSVRKSFPRVRGDVPDFAGVGVDLVEFSPRARGCSPMFIPWDCAPDVFPACAGMFPISPV